MAASAAFAILAFLAACAGGPRAEGTYGARVPAELRGSYDLFAQRCSKCHSLSRPLDSGIDSDEDWARYVERMRLQPGSGITVADETEILKFLRFYAAEQRRRKAGPVALPAEAGASRDAEAK